MTGPSEQDQVWLSRLQAGDRAALDHIFQTYYPALYQSAWQILRDPEAAKDSLQEVFLRVWQKREQIHVTLSLRSYLQRAVINQCISIKRAQKKFSPEEDLPELEDQPVDQHAILAAEHLQQRVELAIAQLPPQCALIFRLSRFEELSYREIAEQLDIAPKTVENQIGKALKFLRQALEPYLLVLLILLSTNPDLNNLQARGGSLSANSSHTQTSTQA